MHIFQSTRLANAVADFAQFAYEMPFPLASPLIPAAFPTSLAFPPLVQKCTRPRQKVIARLADFRLSFLLDMQCWLLFRAAVNTLTYASKRVCPAGCVLHLKEAWRRSWTLLVISLVYLKSCTYLPVFRKDWLLRVGIALPGIFFG